MLWERRAPPASPATNVDVVLLDDRTDGMAVNIDIVGKLARDFFQTLMLLLFNSLKNASSRWCKGKARRRAQKQRRKVTRSYRIPAGLTDSPR